MAHKNLLLIFLLCFNISLIFAQSQNDTRHGEKWLTSISAREGSCKCVHPPTYINYTQLSQDKTFYFPMASAHTYRLYAEILLGRSATCVEELEDMCLVNIFAEGITTTTGYGGRIYTQKSYFLPGQPGVYKCDPIYGSTGTDIKRIEHNIGTFATYDVEHNEDWYHLLVRCIDGKWADWQLASSTPTVSDEVASKVTKKLFALGFKKELIMRLACAEGNKKKYDFLNE